MRSCLIPQSPDSPPLRKLLALDNDFPTFEGKLDQIESVLGDPDGARDCQHGQAPSLYYRGNPRTEWVLRWLLTKLKLDDSDGPAARSSWTAWRLLTRTILGLPPSVSAKALSVHTFLHTLEKTLQDNFVDKRSPKEDFESTKPKTTKPSKKRKRDGTFSSSLERNDPLALFDAVVEAASTVVDLGFDNLDGQDKSVTEFVKSALRADIAQAARLFGLWLQSAHRLIAQESLEERPDLLARILPQILRIWEASVPDQGGEGQSSAEQFSQHCLVPAVVLLSDVTAKSSCDDGTSNGSLTIESKISSVLETLLAKHIFVPARAVFFADAEGGRFKSKSTSAQLFDRSISFLLNPLRAALDGRSANVNSPGPLDSDRRKVFEIVASLMDVCIRCSQRSTPKKRLDEAPWLQNAFTGLCDCIGAPVYGSAGKIDGDRRMVLDRMIDTLAKRKATLESEVLANVVKFYSGIFAGEDEFPQKFDHRLLARIIDYDSTVFVNSPSSSSQDDEASLADAIFNAVTHASKLITKNDGVLMDSVVLPLLKAYAQVRDLKGFISRWFAQLKSIGISSFSMEKSIWARKELSIGLREVLETRLTARQLFDMFSEYLQRVSACDTMSKSAELNEASASLIVLDALVSALQSDDTIASVQEVLRSIQRTLFFFTGVSKEPATVARALRIVARVHVLLRPYQEVNEVKNAAERVLKKDGKSVVEIIKAAEKSDDDEIAARGQEAFNLVATLCSDFMAILDLKAPAKDLFNESAAVLFRSNDKVLKNITEGAKRRRTEDSVAVATSRLESFTLNAAAVLTQYPSLLDLPSLDSLSDLLRLLFWHAFGEFAGHFESSQPMSFGLVFEAMSDIILSMPSHDLRDVLFTVLYEGLEPESKQGKSKDVRHQLLAFSELQYLRMPLSAISRKHREQIVNRLCELCCGSGKKGPSSEALFRHLSVLVKLMGAPNATSELATDTDSLWNIARLVQKTTPTNKDLLILLDELVCSTLENTISVKDQPRGQQYLKGFKDIMSRFVKGCNTFKDHNAELICFKSALRILEKADCLGDEEEAYKTMKRYLRTLDDDLDKVLPDPKALRAEDDDAFLKAVLQAVSDLPTSSLGRDGYLLSIESKLLKVARVQSKSSSSILQSEASSWVSIAEALANISSPDEAQTVSTIIYDLWELDLSATDRHALLKACRKALGSLGLDLRAAMLSSLVEEEDQSTHARLVLANILISSLPDNPGKEEISGQSLNGFVARLSTYLETVENMRDLHAALNCIDTVLKEKHWLVSQYAVESLIESLSRLSSPVGPELPEDQASIIYTRICNTTQLIIALHRTRLGGRFHVLIPLLQRLLRCLFKFDMRQTNLGASLHPPWLSTRSDSSPMHVAQAASFARLITTLCSPTVSAVRGFHRARKRPANGHTELVDDTKKAREYAGQYVTALIATFCAAQLAGRISPESRAALMPALYACADVVGVEGMRAMNAGMGAAERAIWKGVYADWRRFGRWEGR
ncbi:Urb2/Npa2 family-domain-containing protein [Phyllosticta citribraziliensis]|uniref:Urb2/Npa2 family-domain-containing protein n=1 Tax=Phyllosticta citribraziliensis TaxID=989973 RepID=A0ABR1L2U0_9PEZI